MKYIIICFVYRFDFHKLNLLKPSKAYDTIIGHGIQQSHIH